MLGEENESHLLHIQCRKCLNALLALVFISPMGMSSIGLITDLSFDDALKFKEDGAVTADDVLSAYELLQDDETFFAALV